MSHAAILRPDARSCRDAPSPAGDQAIAAVIREELGERADRTRSPFERAGIDSFELLSLRVALEERLGRSFEDNVWTRMQTLEDIVEACSSAQPSNHPAAAAAAQPMQRQYRIGMPQMALCGLSEVWLFKELGDMHWALLTGALGTRSSRLTDGEGNRLYATFTRVKLGLSHSLRSFQEDDELEIGGSAARYGEGVLTGVYDGSAGSRSFRAELMSSFSRREAAGSNQSLLKGQPRFPHDSGLARLTQEPAIMQEYRSRRRAPRAQSLHEGRYRIDPHRDINGVGLLYFAAYPAICDACETDYLGGGPRRALRASTISRDICYFANADIDEEIVYRVHAYRQGAGLIEIEATLSRVSDGTLMAHVVTRKALLDG